MSMEDLEKVKQEISKAEDRIKNIETQKKKKTKIPKR